MVSLVQEVDTWPSFVHEVGDVARLCGEKAVLVLLVNAGVVLAPALSVGAKALFVVVAKVGVVVAFCCG